MIPAVIDIGFQGVLIICRVGSCMMLLPGIGSARLPMRIRSLLALAVSLALFSLLREKLPANLNASPDTVKFSLLFSEIFAGISLGLVARFFMVGLMFSATIVTNMIGLAPTPGTPIDDTEAVPPLVTFISLCGTVMVFSTNLHFVLLRALVDSYDLVKVGGSVDLAWNLERLVGALLVTSELGLRLSGPYIVYSIIVNMAVGFVNKFTAQISIYFLTTGLVAAGGLFIIYFTIADWLNLFAQEFLTFFK